MSYSVVTSYPFDAVGGADFLTGAAARKIIDVDAGGEEFTRPERIVVCDKHFQAEDLVEGRVCLSETSIRSLGAAVDLHDHPSWVRLERRARHAANELAEALAENERLRTALDALAGTIREHPLAKTA